MLSDSQLSISNAIILSIVAFIGLTLYAGFAYVITRTRRVDVRRRWKYSILVGTTFAILSSVVLNFIFLSALFVDGNNLGFMVLFNKPRDLTDIFTGLILFLVYPILINIPLMFLITLTEYISQVRTGDLIINHILYPVEKHSSDKSPDSIFARIRKIASKLIT